VVGTIQGSATDIGLPGMLARDIQVTLGGPGGMAQLSGVESFGPYLSGVVAGSIRFSDAAGASSHCSEIRWSLQRAFWLE
jgi:hypothetical protein